MKVFGVLVLLFGVFSLNEACGRGLGKRNRSQKGNPKIIVRTDPPVTDAVQELTEAVAAETTPRAIEAQEVTNAPRTTEKPEESTKPAEEERPTSVFRFRKRPAVVGSNEVVIECSEVDGVCRRDCESNEFLKGRFACAFPTNCCVRRKLATTEGVVAEVAETTEKPVTTEEIVAEVAQGNAAELTTDAPTAEPEETTAKPATESQVLIKPKEERPKSVFKFRKQSAFVSSNQVLVACGEVNGQCRAECQSDEYLKGRFGCAFPTNCCVQR